MSCSDCKVVLKTGLACNTCEDFKLCTGCYGKTGHRHDMKQVTLTLSTGLFPGNNQLSGCVSQVPQHPVNCFIQNFTQMYLKHLSNTVRKVFQALFKHLLLTNLVCNCVFCKKILLICKLHYIKCQVPLCSLENCRLISDERIKSSIPTKNDKFLSRIMMKLDLMRKRIQITSSRPATNPIPRYTAIFRYLLRHKVAVQRSIRTLVHASQCVEANCMPGSCQKMKRFINHVKACRGLINCSICEQICILCCIHAKSCRDSECSVLLCPEIKRKIEERENRKRCLVSSTTP